MFKMMSTFLNTFSGFIMKGFNEIEQEQLKEIFFQILSTINLHKNFIEILVSVNKYFAYQSFCLQQAWFIDAHLFLSTLFFCILDTEKNQNRIVHVLTCLMLKEILQQRLFGNIIAARIFDRYKNVRSSMQSSNFSAWSFDFLVILFKFFFSSCHMLELLYSRNGRSAFFFSTYPFRLINLSETFQSLCFTLQLLK